MVDCDRDAPTRRCTFSETARARLVVLALVIAVSFIVSDNLSLSVIMIPTFADLCKY